MFATRIASRIRLQPSTGRFSTAAIARNKPSTPNVEEAKPSGQVGDKPGGVFGPRPHYVSNFDRWLLAWVKRYPSRDAVPHKITEEILLTARSKARVKTCNYMMVASVLMLLWAAITGKRDARAGKSVIKEHYERAIRLQEEGARERAAAAEAEARKNST